MLLNTLCIFTGRDASAITIRDWILLLQTMGPARRHRDDESCVIIERQGNGLFSGNVSLANLTAAGTAECVGAILGYASTTQIAVS